MEIHQSENRAAEAAMDTSRIRTWLACVAVFYPLYWGSQFLTAAFLPLVRAWLFGYRLIFLQASAMGVAAMSAPPDSSNNLASSTQPLGRLGAASGVEPLPGRFATLETALLVVGTVALLAWAGRKRRTLSGLAVAVLGQVALQPLLWQVFARKQAEIRTLLTALFFFAVMALGLRWMLAPYEFGTGQAGGPAESYARRVLTLLAEFMAPLLALSAIFRLVVDFRPFTYPTLMTIVPGVLASLVASVRPRHSVGSKPLLTAASDGDQLGCSAGVPHPARRDAEDSAATGDARHDSVQRSREPGWRAAGVGAAATILVALAASYGGREATLAFDSAREARNREAMSSLPAIPSGLPYPKLFFQRGVNLTAEFPARYDSPSARRMLETLPRYGVNAVALVPYGWSRRNPPRVEINSGARSWESDEGLEMLSRVAHARGIKVLLKPGIWGEGGYAGDVEFSSAEDRARWFEQYRVFLEHYARLATRIHADVFSVGGEFQKLSPYDAEWRKLIGRVRELYPGPLVYAANLGPEFESITFWDALDYIGLQEYYPLPDNLSTETVLEKVEAVERRYQRPVIFTEAGFASSDAPHRRPWDDSSSGKPALEQQARCYEAVLRAFYSKPWFEGVYWWKVGTNAFGGREDRSHTPWGKPAMDVVARWYLEGGR